MNNTSFNKAILIIGPEKFGGAERRFARAFMHLSKTDDSIYLIINRQLYTGLVNHNIPVDTCTNILILDDDLKGSSTIKNIAFCALATARIKQFITQNHIKLIHMAASWLYINIILAFYKDVVIGISVVDPSVGEHMTLFQEKLFKTIIAKCDFVDCLSEDIKRILLDKCAPISLNHKTYTSPCSFTDYENFYPVESKKPSIVFLSRLVHTKQPDLLVDAIPLVMERLSSPIPGLTFHILGDGPMKNELINKSLELGIETYVDFSYAEEPAAYLRDSSIFVSLQKGGQGEYCYGDNYPSQSLLEAMACGNAIIATDIGETWRLIDEHTGITIAPTPTELADAIVYFLEHPEQVKALGANARNKVLKEHTIERFTQYLKEELYIPRPKKSNG